MTSVFVCIGILAITAGGTLMAFSARKPSWFISWVSAYLVLVVGIIQTGLVAGWHALHEPNPTLALLAFVSYNVGNLGIILGTALRTRTRHYFTVVTVGSILLAAAMLLVLAAVHNVHSSWTLTGLITLAVILFVSMPIGIGLSSRHRKA